MRFVSGSPIDAWLRTDFGLRAGRAAYAKTARAIAAGLACVPDVVAVYATGSLLGPTTLAPGHSDIDLVVVASLPTDEREVRLVRRLRRIHRCFRPLGGLLYNLDLVSLEELPLVRAFGNAWAIELDQNAICLAGQPVWMSPARRPARELTLQRFAQAFRRWVNTGGLLLDPRSRKTAEGRSRSADRLLSDVGFAWLGQPRHQSLELLASELGARGIALDDGNEEGPVEARVGSRLRSTLEVLDRFARDVVDTNEPWSVRSPEPSPPGHEALSHLSSEILGGSLATLTALRRAPSLDDWVPIIVLDEGAALGPALEAAHAAIASAGSALTPWSDVYRRLVVLTPALWQAGAFFDPAPFAGASATFARAWGTPLPTILAPSASDTTALLRARTAESFTTLSAIGLRGRSRPSARARSTAHGYGRLLPALRRAREEGLLGTGEDLPSDNLPRTEEDAVARRREWLAEERERSLPLAMERLRG